MAGAGLDYLAIGLVYDQGSAGQCQGKSATHVHPTFAQDRRDQLFYWRQSFRSFAVIIGIMMCGLHAPGASGLTLVSLSTLAWPDASHRYS